MNYINHRKQLVKLAHRYMVFMFECGNPDDVAKLESELLRMKNEIAHIDAMTEYKKAQERQTIEWTVTSIIEFI
ncbi:hypothetical protein [Flavobacterium coralii]|uniref:hypothetical protein n=1 Tax=Flavobacterium coralii TaxID=2838017 RepID=UPI000C4AE033|nr:hypothetical protein [Flavobacterium sp.]|tara:strand:- start:25904 stop:26125 length:222 start_codon:yes stop_codon:yes gene_type:complete